MNKYQVIKKLCNNGATPKGKNRAVITLGVSKRSIERYIVGYREFGKEFFKHKNRGRKPANVMTTKEVNQVISLINKDYYDMGLTHFNEYLKKDHNINYSDCTIRNVFDKN